MLVTDWLRIGGAVACLFMATTGLFDGFRSLITGAKPTGDGILHIVFSILFLVLAEALAAPVIKFAWNRRRAIKRIVSY